MEKNVPILGIYTEVLGDKGVPGSNLLSSGKRKK